MLCNTSNKRLEADELSSRPDIAISWQKHNAQRFKPNAFPTQRHSKGLVCTAVHTIGKSTDNQGIFIRDILFYLP